MFKKITFLTAVLFAISLACKKEEVCYNYYKINSFELSINTTNLGIFPDQGANTDSTIGSIRNQLMVTYDKNYVAHTPVIKSNGFDFIPTAYAARCVNVDVSETSFDPIRTELTINRIINLEHFGSSGVILEGGNLLENEYLRNEFLSEIVENGALHGGMDMPITISEKFLKHFNGEKVTFGLKLYTETGLSMTDNVTVIVDL